MCEGREAITKNEKPQFTEGVGVSGSYRRGVKLSPFSRKVTFHLQPSCFVLLLFPPFFGNAQIYIPAVSCLLIIWSYFITDTQQNITTFECYSKMGFICKRDDENFTASMLSLLLLCKFHVLFLARSGSLLRLTSR